MEIIMIITIGTVGLLMTGSVAMNKYFADKPVNGEVKHLEKIENKLNRNVEQLRIITKQDTHYVKTH